eukprot:m.99227 g.99227  ORF g.99227 m.99227 type:complete len:1631 (-) comp15325_c0_seq1:1583-6475(-)
MATRRSLGDPGSDIDRGYDSTDFLSTSPMPSAPIAVPGREFGPRAGQLRVTVVGIAPHNDSLTLSKPAAIALTHRRLATMLTPDDTENSDPSDHEVGVLTVTEQGLLCEPVDKPDSEGDSSNFGFDTIFQIDKTQLRQYVRFPDSLAVGLVATLGPGSQQATLTALVTENTEAYNVMVGLLDRFMDTHHTGSIDSELSRDSGVGGSREFHVAERDRRSDHQRSNSDSDILTTGLRPSSSAGQTVPSAEAQVLRQGASCFYDRLSQTSGGVFEYEASSVRDAGSSTVYHGCFYCKDAISFLVQQGDVTSRSAGRSYLQQLLLANAIIPVKSLSGRVVHDKDEIFRFAPGVAGRIRSVSMSANHSLASSVLSIDSPSTHSSSLTIPEIVGDLPAEVRAACKADDWEAVEQLLPNLVESPHLQALLWQASLCDAPRVARCCVENGAKLSHRDRNGQTPLHVACTKGHSRVVTALLEAGAKPDARDNQLRTPLALTAASQELHQICVLLIESGASVHIPDREGNRPVDIQPGLAETAALLSCGPALAFAGGKGSLESLRALDRLSRNQGNHEHIIKGFLQPGATEGLRQLCLVDPQAAESAAAWLSTLLAQPADMERIFRHGFVKIALPLLVDTPISMVRPLLTALVHVTNIDDVGILLSLARQDPASLVHLVCTAPAPQSEAAAIVLTRASRLAACTAQLVDGATLSKLTEPIKVMAKAVPGSSPAPILADMLAIVANIAMNPNSQAMLHTLRLHGALERLASTDLGVRIAHHASRALVYLGEVRLRTQVFSSCMDEHTVAAPVVKGGGTGHTLEHPWATIKGTDLETLVTVVTDDINPVPCEQLFAVSSQFWSPLAMFRLFCHRFFCLAMERKCSELPMLHRRVITILKEWLIMSTHDFADDHTLLRELKAFVKQLESAGGGYKLAADELLDLAVQVEGDDETPLSTSTWEHRKSLHNRLYKSARDEVLSGHSPCTEAVAVTLAAMQVHIEDLERRAHNLCSSSTTEFVRWRQIIDPRRCPSFKVRRVVPPFLLKTKREHLQSKIEAEFARICTLSDRDVKHQYVYITQLLNQNGCSYFRIRQIVSMPNPKHPEKPHSRHVNRLLGVGVSRLMLLEPDADKVLEERSYTEFRRFDRVFLREKNKRGFHVVSSGKGVPHLILSFSDKDIVITASATTLESVMETVRSCVAEAMQAAKARRSRSASIGSVQHGAGRPVCVRAWEDTPPSKPGATTTQRPAAAATPTTPATATPKGLRASPLGPSSPPGSPGAQPVRAASDGEHDVAMADQLVSIPETSESREVTPNHTPVTSPTTTPTTTRRRVAHATTASVAEGARPGSGNGVTHGEIAAALEAFTRTAGPATAELPQVACLCKCAPVPVLGDKEVQHMSLLDLLRFPLEFARQMSLFDFAAFKLIKPHHCVNRVFVSKSPADRGADPDPTALEVFVQQFNHMSSWFAFVLVDEPDVAVRAEMISRMVDTCKALHDLGNYNGLMVITSALGSAAVRRLANTWSRVGEEQRKTLQRFDELMIAGQKTHYRRELRKRQPPLVPYFGLVLSDLVALHEGNQSYVRGGYVNVFKWFQIIKTIRRFQKMQRIAYNFVKITEFQQLFASVDGYDDESIYQRSLEVNPRE